MVQQQRCKACLNLPNTCLKQFYAEFGASGRNSALLCGIRAFRWNSALSGEARKRQIPPNSADFRLEVPSTVCAIVVEPLAAPAHERTSGRQMSKQGCCA
eukprot:5248468-Alexandrium_andersonii.AAC.1